MKTVVKNTLPQLWMHRCRAEGCTTCAFDGATLNGHLNVVKWLHKNRAEGCTTSASNGHFEVVMWLHFNRSEGCTTKAIDGAASHGILLVVDLLHKNRSEGCTAKAMINAASKDSLMSRSTYTPVFFNKQQLLPSLLQQIMATLLLYNIYTKTSRDPAQRTLSNTRIKAGTPTLLTSCSGMKDVAEHMTKIEVPKSVLEPCEDADEPELNLKHAFVLKRKLKFELRKS
ncbi:hypothetical protein PHPALM_5233 [Phytophthora palmivora]|uniref:Uncharacterized protein n=1 Tax=Phytophthora palmivora TaxID=4796 RepID=A0A2P4YHV1_9STRA|nr:hypothetical protein PHPALM_5233 [Phytophthora palmivora]